MYAAAEEDVDGIPDLDFPNGDASLNEIRFDGWTKEDIFYFYHLGLILYHLHSLQERSSLIIGYWKNVFASVV